MVRDLACFCEYYLDEEWEFCVNVAHIGWWRLETLKSLNANSIHIFNAIDQANVGQKLDFGSNGESLVIALKPSDNFVVFIEHANDKGVDFYL